MLFLGSEQNEKFGPTGPQPGLSLESHLLESGQLESRVPSGSVQRLGPTQDLTDLQCQNSIALNQYLLS